MLTTRSPGWKPARSAALPGLTISTLAAVMRSPNKAKIAVKISDRQDEIGNGPAATTAARWPKGFPWKLRLRSSGVIWSSGFWPALAAFSSSMNFT